MIKFNHLPANMLIFHTVVHQTKAVNKLREDGMDIPDEVLTGFSPYWRDHLNRFGVFTLDMGRNTAKIDYKLPIFEISSLLTRIPATADTHRDTDTLSLSLNS